MKQILKKTAFVIGATAALLTGPGFSMEAEAKIKDQRFHFVHDSFYEPIVMQMKYQNGRWQWINSNKTFEKRVKLKVVSTKKFSNAKILLVNAPAALYNYKIWELPRGQATKKVEILHTFSVGKTLLAGYQNAAATKCSQIGGNKKVTSGQKIPAVFNVQAPGKPGGSDVKGNLDITVVCEAYKKPAVPAFKVTKLKLYTLPAKPQCGENVKMVAEFHTNKPGKVKFNYYRGDGEFRKGSVVTTKGGKGYVKRWASNYVFHENTKRKYKVVVIGDNKATGWVPLHVKCGVKAGQKGINGLKG